MNVGKVPAVYCLHRWELRRVRVSPETNASSEGLGAVLSQKQPDGK